MKINRLELHNFRCFKKYEIAFSDRFTLLIGDNGSGKTAILDGLVIGLGDYLFEIANIKANDKRRISLNDMRHVDLILEQPVLKNTPKTTFISINGVFNNESIHWVNGRGVRKYYCINKDTFDESDENPFKESSKKFINLIKKLTEEKANPNFLYPVVAYYGTGRLWKQLKTIDKKTNVSASRFEGYKDCLNPASDQKRFLSWFKLQELEASQKPERRNALEAVRGAIVSMIPDAQRVMWEGDKLMIETLTQGKLQTIPFHLLSDGYRNMIGLVADIAYRMATLNPQLEADVIKQTEGIVLIDEIDLHLHPKWQKQVVERLLDTFPKVQFVASSHSPFIIQSLYHREDCLLWDLEKNAPVEVDRKSIEDIAENQQGVKIPQQSQRFLDMEKAAEEYYTVLKQIPPAGEDEKQRLRQRLDELLLPYSDDPAFQAFLKMERQAVEGSAEE